MMAAMMTSRGLMAAGLSVLLFGCVGNGRSNPSFSVTASEAKRAMRQMEHLPRPLDRPVVVLGGFNDPGVAAGHLAREVRRLTGDGRVLAVSFGFCEPLDDCRRRVVRAVDRAFPAADPVWTCEVDVIAVSLGGVVARHAAAPSPAPAHNRRLRVARLFTISSPHRGAAIANLPSLPFAAGVQADLRPGSKFLRALERGENPLGYELIPYARLGDGVVGDANTAPTGRTPYWVPTPPFQDAHFMAYSDPRIVADIARRLRGEPPFATDPSQPLPGRRRPGEDKEPRMTRMNADQKEERIDFSPLL